MVLFWVATKENLSQNARDTVFMHIYISMLLISFVYTKAVSTLLVSSYYQGEN